MKIKNTVIKHIRKKFLSCLYYWEKYPAAASAVVFFVFFVVFGFIAICNTGDAPMDDHYFHFKFAALVAENGIEVVKNFDWIYLNAISSEDARYQISLYHAFIMPFTFFEDQMFGLKMFDIFTVSIFLSLIYYILRKSRVSYPLFFTLFLCISQAFLMRMFLGRAFILAVAFIFLEMYFAINKKYKLLLLITIFHIMWHQSSFFMPIGVVFVVEVARYLFDKTIYFKNIIFTALGIFVGMTIYSLFPKNMYLIFSNILSVQSSSSTFEHIEAGELIKKDFVYDLLLQNEFFLLISVISISIAIFLYIKLKGNKKIVIVKSEQIVAIYAHSLFLLIIIFGSLIISGRLFDYFIPAAVIAFALVATLIWKNNIISIRSDLQKLLYGILYTFLILICLGSFIAIKIKYANTSKIQFKEAAEWIEMRSQEKDRVFLDAWGYFVLMFFYNDKNTYSMGLEPNDARKYRPDLYWKWYNFTNNAFFCEDNHDCKGDAKVFFDTVNELDEKNIKRYNAENSRKIINSILYDFNAEFIVSDNRNFNQVLHYNADMIRDSIQIRSDDNKVLIEVFQLKKTNE